MQFAKIIFSQNRKIHAFTQFLLQRTLSSSEGTIAAEGQDVNCVDEEGKIPSRQNSDEAKLEYVSR